MTPEGNMQPKERAIAYPILISMAILGLFFACAGAHHLLQIPFYLFVGWLTYPLSILDKITIDTTSIVVAVIALILFTAGVHWLSRWINSLRATEEKPATWSIRNSVFVVLLVLFAFVAGTSLVGIVHQLTWLATTEEDLIESNFHQFQRSTSRNNLKWLGLAFHDYHDTHDVFPTSTFSAEGKSYHSWQTGMLPFIDQATLYNEINFDVPWSAPENDDAISRPVQEFLNPGVEQYDTHSEQTDSPAISHYAANIHVIQPGRSLRLDDIKDGTSTTILSGEVNANFKAWADPLNLRDPLLGLNQTPNGFGSPYTAGGHMLFADGSVQFFSDTIDPAILNALATPHGGEEIPDDAY